MKYNGQQEFDFATESFNLIGDRARPETAPARETIPTEEEKREHTQRQEQEQTEELKNLEI
jgi:hypothetical protein